MCHPQSGPKPSAVQRGIHPNRAISDSLLRCLKPHLPRAQERPDVLILQVTSCFKALLPFSPSCVCGLLLSPWTAFPGGMALTLCRCDEAAACTFLLTQAWPAHSPQAGTLRGTPKLSNQCNVFLNPHPKICLLLLKRVEERMCVQKGQRERERGRGKHPCERETRISC